MRTLRQLAQEAIDVQNACNILGVSKSYAQAMDDLWEALNAGQKNIGLAHVSNHAIAQLWCFKLADMHHLGVGENATEGYGAVYETCRRLAERRPIEEVAEEVAAIYGQHDEGASADAGFDGGEFSGPWHAEAAQRKVDAYLAKEGYSFDEVNAYFNEAEPEVGHG